jgi:branched-chain amino acid transport system permease protein
LSFYFVQFVTGLASACSLFLVASGLSIIFGVTRVVNFAHGAFYMLGAYIGYTLTDRLSGPVGFWAAIVLAALCVAAIGTLIEMSLLRRVYDAPVLFQLLATFGVTLVVEDLVLLIWGPGELLGPRAPGFKGAIDLFGHPFPTYDLLLIALAPLVLAFIWLVFHRTTWGGWCAPRLKTARWWQRLASTRNGSSPVSSRSASFSRAWAARLNCRGRPPTTRWTCR